MPRYSSFQVRSASILQNSPPIGPESKSQILSNKKYYSLSNDVKLSWDGDIKIDPNTKDYVVSYDLEAFTQRIFRRMITQEGTHPGNEYFGWDFEYLFSTPYQQQIELLPFIAKTVENSLRRDPEVESVSNVEAYIERDSDNFTHKIVINLQIIPTGYNNEVSLVLESV